MGIGNQLLFFLAGLGVFNGFLLVFYFIFGIKPQKWINVLFGLLMLMLCIRIGKSLFHVFTDIDWIYRQIGLSACFMIGPFLYLYVQRMLSNINAPGKFDYIHITVSLFSIIGIGIVWPYESYQDLWNNHLVILIYGVWILYMIATYWMIAPLIKKTYKQESTIIDHWILLVYSCILILCIAYNLALLGFPYLAGPILFSIVLYVLFGFLFSKKNRSIITLQEPTKYLNQKVSDQKANDLLKRLSAIMQTQQSYLNQSIKLAHIAKSIDSTPHEVSQVINDRLGISFNHYINEFRIKAACAMLKETDHLSIEGIGQEVGFKSRSTFYNAFKVRMNQTPAQYKSKVKNAGL